MPHCQMHCYLKPNLFVIGAAKCGTTSLHHYLNRHPDIFMSEPKEPGYFVKELRAFPKDENWYLGLFADAEKAAYRGESSTHYTKLPTYAGVPERIAKFCDDPHFIYLMRDPIDRAISHYWHNTRQNTEFRSPIKAMRQNVEYRAYGDYALQLEAYFRVFGRQSVFVATFENLVSDPQSVTGRIFDWLRLDPKSAPDELPSENVTPNQIDRFILGQALGEFVHSSQAWNRLSPLVPQKIKDLAKHLTWASTDPYEQPMDEVVELLRPWATEVTARTAKLLDRQFPEWTTTRG